CSPLCPGWSTGAAGLDQATVSCPRRGGPWSGQAVLVGQADVAAAGSGNPCRPGAGRDALGGRPAGREVVGLASPDVHDPGAGSAGGAGGRSGIERPGIERSRAERSGAPRSGATKSFTWLARPRWPTVPVAADGLASVSASG